MALNVKAFLEKNGDVKGETRRFQLPTSPPEKMYRMLTHKVAGLFSLPEDSFDLFWLDSDGDFVTFSSSAEITEAVQNSADDLLRIYIQRKPDCEKTSEGATADEKSKEEKVHHPGVICDGCEGSVYGIRYKCIVCPDYDLCSDCEQKGLHPEHNKLKITRPRPSGPRLADILRGAQIPHWMQGFIQRGMAGHSWCPAGASAATPTAGADSRNESRNQEGYSEFEENVVKFFRDHVHLFNSWGIPMDLEVYRDSRPPNRGQSENNGHEAGKCSKDGNESGKHESPKHTPESPKPSTSTEEEKPEDKADETTAKKSASEEMPSEEELEEVQITMEEDATVPDSPKTPCQKEASPTGSNDEDWTMLNEGDVTTDGEPTSSARPVPLEGLYPNLKVAQAVEMMKAMGFNDDDGWLTGLLGIVDGDIVQALDMLKNGGDQSSH